ncbi:hypothetical protein GIB67_043152, partial [Kingdonia uniflora]
MQRISEDAMQEAPPIYITKGLKPRDSILKKKKKKKKKKGRLQYLNVTNALQVERPKIKTLMYQVLPEACFDLAVIFIIVFAILGIAYGFLAATMAIQRIWQRHYHILTKRELTK